MFSIEAIMSTDLITLPPDATVAEARTLMHTNRIHHLPVVDDGRLCGMVTIGDVVIFRLNELEYEALQLKQMIVG